MALFGEMGADRIAANANGEINVRRYRATDMLNGRARGIGVGDLCREKNRPAIFYDAINAKFSDVQDEKEGKGWTVAACRVEAHPLVRLSARTVA